MSAGPQNNDQPPKAVSVAQWQKQMGLGVPPLGSVISCANCMKQVEVKEESWMLPRLAHSDAVVLCTDCARPHLPAAAAPAPEFREADPWSSAETGDPADPAGQAAVSSERAAGAAGSATAPSLDTEVTLQGMVELDADMQAGLRIDTAKDVSRILQRLQQVLVAADFLKTTPDGQPPALLTDALDFITGRSEHCVIVLQQWEASRPSAVEPRPADDSAGERVEDKPS